MAKILLVEDDNNLREIYEARLQAEGYNIVSAHDGEEALVVAKAEKPDLIISDVMMPKISGFEMLDILRNTDSLKDVKVIMLTALGQSDDQQRADKLGADRYLVKSQVTLEDIVKVANELLQTNGSTPADLTTTSTPSSETNVASTTPPISTNTTIPEPVNTVPTPVQSAPAPTIAPAPQTINDINLPPTVVSTPTPVVTAPPVSTPSPSVTEEPQVVPIPSLNLAQTAGTEQNEVKSQIENFISAQPPAPASEPVGQEGVQQPSTSTPITVQDDGTTTIQPSPTSQPITPPSEVSSNSSESQAGYSPQPVGKKVIEPLPDSENKPNLNELLEKEKAKEILESGASPVETPPTMSAADTAPTPAEPVITPSSGPAPAPAPAHEGADPDSIAL